MTVEYDALVYDLDGTLVELDVDWDEVTAESAAVLSARGVDTDGMNLWDVLETAETRGLRRKVEDIIETHEREGARTAARLPLADELPVDVPVAVCSLNSEAACRIALEMHGLDGHVRALVGRDTVETEKPDPEPLLAAIRGLRTQPSQTLFIGDTQRDRRTAQQAGVPFQHAEDRIDLLR
ncbi:HAD family hydrolase [Salinibaculum salinum]|uniref:HAD family hydrolase n=1 Tax=Salinibaculum salinum TaxID=3131996 RepID=UPI0030EF1DFD